MRRVKILYVSHLRVLTFLSGSAVSRPDGAWLVFPVASGLPPDVKTLSVHEDFLRRAFCFLLEHPSFDEVPDNVVPPEIPVEWRTVQFRYRGNPEDSPVANT